MATPKTKRYSHSDGLKRGSNELSVPGFWAYNRNNGQRRSGKEIQIDQHLRNWTMKVEKNTLITKFDASDDMLRLVDQLKQALWCHDKSGLLTLENIEDSFKFLLRFRDNIVLCFQRQTGKNSVGPDDIALLTQNAFVRGLIGQNRIDMDIFMHIEESIGQSVEVKSGEKELFEIVHFYAIAAEDWLIENNFVERNAVWTKQTLDLKIVVLGKNGVGKTSLLTRYKYDSFNPNVISTQGVDYIDKSIKLPFSMNELQCKVKIWDTAGQERFRAITKNYMRGAHGVLLVHDDTDENESPATVLAHYNDLLQEAHEGLVPFVFFANKADLGTRVISEEEQSSNKSNHFSCFSGSAFTGDQVQEAFHSIVCAAAQFRMNNECTELNTSANTYSAETTRKASGVIRLSPQEVTGDRFSWCACK